MKQDRGLYGKFRVARIDGDPAGKHDGCRYFVLDASHDRHAPAALRAYAESCREEFPALAADLEALAGPGGRPATRVVVEIDADQVRERIRAAAVELVEERDRARATAVRFEQLADAQRALLVRAAGLLRDAGRSGASDTLLSRLDELELEIDEAVDDDATCACPDGAVDGHVCEAS